jgi:hypothetical protein
VSQGGIVPSIVQLQEVYKACLAEQGSVQGNGCLPQGFTYTGAYWSSEDSNNPAFPTEYARTFEFTDSNTVHPSGGTIGEAWKTSDAAAVRCILR